VRRDRIPFGWDNEFDEHVVEVAAFGCDVNDVTNGDYLAYVRAGGPKPPFWVEGSNGWELRTLREMIPLPLSWPVYCSNAQAAGREWTSTTFEPFQGFKPMISYLPYSADFSTASTSS
jgi:formylglycine-generating enzyme required for sulfatase activity